MKTLNFKHQKYSLYNILTCFVSMLTLCMQVPNSRCNNNQIIKSFMHAHKKNVISEKWPGRPIWLSESIYHQHQKVPDFLQCTCTLECQVVWQTESLKDYQCYYITDNTLHKISGFHHSTVETLACWDVAEYLFTVCYWCFGTIC